MLKIIIDAAVIYVEETFIQPFKDRWITGMVMAVALVVLFVTGIISTVDMLSYKILDWGVYFSSSPERAVLVVMYVTSILIVYGIFAVTKLINYISKNRKK